MNDNVNIECDDSTYVKQLTAKATKLLQRMLDKFQTFTTEDKEKFIIRLREWDHYDASE